MSIYGQAINPQEVIANIIWRPFTPLIGATPFTGNTLTTTNVAGRYSVIANKFVYFNAFFRITASTGTPAGIAIQGPPHFTPRSDQRTLLAGLYSSHMIFGVCYNNNKLMYGSIGGASQPVFNSGSGWGFPMYNYDGTNPIVINSTYSVWGTYVK